VDRAARTWRTRGRIKSPKNSNKGLLRVTLLKMSKGHPPKREPRNSRRLKLSLRTTIITLIIVVQVAIRKKGSHHLTIMMAQVLKALVD